MMEIELEAATDSVVSFAGRPSELSDQLHGLKNERVVVIAIDDISQSENDALENMLRGAARLFRQTTEEQLAEKIAFLAKAFAPKEPPTPVMLKEAEMMARAQKAVFASADWLTASQVATVAGFSDSNLSAQPSKWRREGTIFTVRLDGTEYFPGYGLDRDHGYRPLKALKKIIDLFKGHKEGWGLAYWFASDNSFLGGKRPLELLKTAPEQVLAAAQDELEGIVHA